MNCSLAGQSPGPRQSDAPKDPQRGCPPLYAVPLARKLTAPTQTPEVIGEPEPDC